ncbi:MAG: 16S rRNA (cytosine(1402)-N(4))-methyltransferase RsmH [Proteobacteria bacterium]|nr:16S rRNA (cytosine(1402)-N(4))-methyltransferase RsmH [Pseudomonadota bacterium]
METTQNLTHQTVLAKEAVDALLHDATTHTAPVYVDATFGGGGHSRLILQQLPPQGRLLAMDCDQVAAERARDLSSSAFMFAHRNYSDLALALPEHGVEQVCGVLFDLGVSSMQLDDGARGFSFNADAPLDMRMDQRTPLSAFDWLQHKSEVEIRQVLRKFGEEPEARRIARMLFERRATLTTTAALAQAVRDSKRQPTPPGRHPATRTFQAIRIAVNEELVHLQKGLEAARQALVVGGRLVVIAFHSLEDRIAKQLATAVTLPGMGRVGGSNLQAVGRMQRPSAEEITDNPRARSACMRVFIKIATAA